MKSTIISLVAIAFLAGCKGNTVTVYEQDLGTYKGKVAQYDITGQPAAGQSGATVSLKGTPFATTTDAAGNYEIDHVPAGIYELIMTKPGYDTAEIGPNQFSGAGTQFVQTYQIQAMPLDSVVALSGSASDSIWFDRRVDSVRWVSGVGYDTFYSTRPDTITTLSLQLVVSGPDSMTLPFCSIDCSVDGFLKSDTSMVAEIGYIAIPQHRSFSIPVKYFYHSFRPKSGNTITVSTRAISMPPNFNPLASPPYPRSPYLWNKKITIQ